MPDHATIIKRIVLATKKILSGERNVANVSYSKGDGELVIMFSHSSTNEAGEFKYTTWEKVEALCPAIAELSFDRDDDILIYESNKKQWERA